MSSIVVKISSDPVTYNVFSVKRDDNYETCLPDADDLVRVLALIKVMFPVNLGVAYRTNQYIPMNIGGVEFVQTVAGDYFQTPIDPSSSPSEIIAELYRKSEMKRLRSKRKPKPAPKAVMTYEEKLRAKGWPEDKIKEFMNE